MKSAKNPRGAGRKPYFEELSVFIKFKVPESKKEEIRKKVKEIINSYRK